MFTNEELMMMRAALWVYINEAIGDCEEERALIDKIDKTITQD